MAIYTLESLDGKPIKSISYYKSPKSLVIWLCWCHLLNTPLGQIYLNTSLIYLETTEARSSPITNITILIFRLFDIVWTMSKYGKYEPEKLRLWTLDALQKLFCGILLIYTHWQGKLIVLQISSVLKCNATLRQNVWVTIINKQLILQHEKAIKITLRSISKDYHHPKVILRK